MKNYLKCLLIIVCGIFLTGFDIEYYDDIVEKYPEYVGKLECNYKTGSVGSNIKKITYKVKGDGFTVSYDDGTDQYILKDSSDDLFSPTDNKGISHGYDYFIFDNFFSSIKNNNGNYECMPTIYICEKDKNEIYDRTDNQNRNLGTMRCIDFNYVKESDLGKNPVKCESDGKEAYNTNAISCNHYSYPSIIQQINRGITYIEIGENADGTNYFAISYDLYNTAEISNYVNGKYQLTSLYGDFWTIGDNDVFKKTNGKYIQNPYINFTVSGENANFYIYSSEEAANSGSGDFSVGQVSPGSMTSIPPLTPPNLVPPTYDTCESLLGDPNETGTTAYYVVFAFRVIKYVAVILLLAMSAIDLIAGVTSGDKDELNKIIKKIINRFIFCVVILLLPTIIRFVLSFVDDLSTDLCGIE